MKNRVVRKILIFVVILTSLFCLNRYISVKADSGWDSDYDSGSSSDSGSDWDSGSSWDNDSNYDSSGSSRSTCTTAECRRTSLIVISVFFVAFFIIVFIKIHKTVKDIKDNINASIDKYNQISDDEANKIISNFNIDEFNFKAYQIFYDVQMSWMEFDYDKLKKLLTDELYNTYEMDLEVLKTKKQKNIMKDFELINIKMISLEESNDIYVAKVVLEVKFIDYVENIDSHVILRGGSTKKLDNTYMLTFIKTKKDQKENICPKCGGKVEGNTTGTCEYCKSKIVNDNYDWVMSKKEKISQR